MTYRVAGSKDAAETQLPAVGTIAPNDVWEEQINMHDGGKVTFDYSLVIAEGIPYWPERDARKS